MWKMVPQVEDDLIDQMLEIKPMEKCSNHVLFVLWKWLDITAKETPENCILLQCKRIYGICLTELQFLEHELLRKFWLDPNLLQVIAGLEWWGLEQYEKDLQGSEWRDEKKKRWLRIREKWSKDKNTEDGVNLRGRGCNVPLIHPKKFRFLNVWCTQFFWWGAQGQGPARRKMIKLI